MERLEEEKNGNKSEEDHTVVKMNYSVALSFRISNICQKCQFFISLSLLFFFFVVTFLRNIFIDILISSVVNWSYLKNDLQYTYLQKDKR